LTPASSFDKRYNAVVVDEVQDLSPTALKLLVKLGESSRLFLTADLSQSLYERCFSFNFVQGDIERDSGNNITERTLTKSFRNTKEISIACPDILIGKDQRNTVLDFYSLSGNKPKIFLTDDLTQQSQAIINFFKDASQQWKLPISAGAILVPSELLGLFITNQLNHVGLNG
jgi:superfamily I DNA/RNA helicase